MRQHDIEADGGTASGKRALVGRLHNPRPAAGNHREARIREAAGNQFGQQVVGMVYRRARAAVYTDGGINGAQFFACLDELRHDFQQMIAFARLNFVARAVGQDGVRQLVLQGHGTTPNWENDGYKPICAALQICLPIQRPSENPLAIRKRVFRRPQTAAGAFICLTAGFGRGSRPFPRRGG